VSDPGGAGGENPVASSPRNELLRQVDWRFLLRQPGLPRALDLTSGRHSQALALVGETASGKPGSADLVVLGRPARAALEAAREALRPGGEVVCLWRLPTPAGAQRARRRLERAGFADARLYWPGPMPYRSPHKFWLPLDSPAAVDYVLAQRPAQSRAKAALRPLWRAAARGGLLAPLCAVARAPGGAPGDELDALLPGDSSWALLTGGQRSINKVVGLPFGEGQSEPAVVVKFARLPEADLALEREAEVLQLLERERSELSGLPRLAAQGRRAGRRAVAQSAVHGQRLSTVLTPENFSDHALRVTRWLVELAGSGPPVPAAEWWPRLVGEPLEQFERIFRTELPPGAAERARGLLEGLGDLPLIPEHGDCALVNVMLRNGGGVGLLDWESAEPRGLPVCDLAFFLADATFALEGSYTPSRMQDAYARLLDPSTACGRVAADCLEQYCRRLGIRPEDAPRLRLLCWIVQARSDHRRIESEAGARVEASALDSLQLSYRLVLEELRRAG
jgi:hypothetical protein